MGGNDEPRKGAAQYAGFSLHAGIGVEAQQEYLAVDMHRKVAHVFGGRMVLHVAIPRETPAVRLVEEARA